MSIFKRYHHGKPDWSHWRMECDCCHRQALMFGPNADAWLVTKRQGMAVYCPDCLGCWADHLIASVLRCPECDYTRLRIWISNDTDPLDERHPNFVDCARCGAIVLITDPPTGRKDTP
ncbi:hypothetical protein GCM10009678_90340 [Actinomadura kijaniata]|uniref:DNA-directed RNA polymerase subunit RPC12/RpoP n=1 Tax=Actinomadura namibiensis TaxID=182080 RepID=A0A7W3LPC7_ACTNM|nr:hypothetical protein [Actinomadura namibiensis]MBA8951891.1 DNA-directed RNA polymerase subunit RPC12/RpoP [Actinomadura namibiensis]